MFGRRPGHDAPDVVCLQETKTATFPIEEVRQVGYEMAVHGLGRWNGVAVLSRVGLDEVSTGFTDEPGFPDPEARALAELRDLGLVDVAPRPMKGLNCLCCPFFQNCLCSYQFFQNWNSW